MPIVVAVARCLNCGHDLGRRQITNWHNLHLPTNPWGDLVAIADAHCSNCFPGSPLPAEVSARHRLQAIEAVARRCTTDSWGLQALGDAVRKLLPANET